MPSTGFARALRLVSLALAALAAAASSAWAQADYPTRPVGVIVEFAAGGGGGLFARLVGQAVGKYRPAGDHREQGRRRRPDRGRVLENQPADGYTVMVAASGQMAIAAAIYPKLAYHPTRDFIPVTMIASFPLISPVPPTTRSRPSRTSSPTARPIPTSRTTRPPRRPSPSPPSCSSSRPACRRWRCPTRAAAR